ncbi:MAG: saccharopine dehydrogenase NADP-binding domain-containing protein [Candidatus Saccharicenans sp.]|nr:saccharopine dehydrogenase NADP-binding domain-containing protein [Candidatus Saccharicenans sp.]HOJ26973.1 saccharopine dehydrogenase C-terminal domain-containing protein [Candidatus Saccharicenans sp.]HOL45757.1 saccharopine dehydrogenase C-terminal domain-containing protein [Candidatus Saccharicenans sp.]HOM95082.1 saccharopine dehydrogenase C-terminal domain-containing protein [Candidatus Saccharicenans sp.]HPP24142.1 saccharopine dehydrogenase C-terminal domain-containing protein [Candi
MKIVVLGAGLVGKAMALDLASEPEFDLTSVDLKQEALAELAAAGIKVIGQDISQSEATKDLVSGYDLVINAVPGYLGFKSLKACLEAGRKVVDISFFPENPFELDSLAKEQKLTAAVDCGVAPGLSNMLAGYGLSQLDKASSVTIYVGGLPVIRKWPFEYNAVFSPVDVIEEYLRPARCLENGQLVIKPALSEPEFLEFEKLGTLEAFITDGLRTMIETLTVPEMVEKTLRYPGHREKMLALRQAGFFSEQPVEIAGQKVRPVDLSAKILFPRLNIEAGEEDLTILRVVVSGEKDGQPLRLTYDLFDRFDRKSGIHSMARTTGYTATAVARAVARGLIKKTGIIAPEFLGLEPEVFNFIRKELLNREIVIKEKKEAG